jgi:hypothetical protein
VTAEVLVISKFRDRLKNKFKLGQNIGKQANNFARQNSKGILKVWIF